MVKLLEQATRVGLAEEDFATGFVGLKLKCLVEREGRRGCSLKGGGVLQGWSLKGGGVLEWTLKMRIEQANHIRFKWL